MTMAAEELNAGARALHNMSDSDLEYLERVAHSALGSSGVSAGVPYAGEGHRLPAGGPHAFSGAHGTMCPIDVVDDESEIPSAQPDPIAVSEESLSGYFGPEPGRQISGSFSDDGRHVADDSLRRDMAPEPSREEESSGHSNGASPQAVVSGGGSDLCAEADVSNSVNSVGGIGVRADADGLWAANSVGADTPAECPLTQAYADEGVHDEVADDDGSASVATASIACSEAGSSTSTAVPGTSRLPSVTYFPTFSEAVARCHKCGREVDPLKTRQTRKEDGEMPGGAFQAPGF